MKTRKLPPRDEMVRAFMERDTSYEGVFFTCVTTTGIFCRPACSARKPLLKNIEFFGTSQDAILAGFRPCKRCRPLEQVGTTPDWVRIILGEVDRDPSRRWRDEDLRRLGLSPTRVRRWFREQHGMTFHAYSRARRLGNAIGQIHHGDTVTRAAFGNGFDSLSGFNDAFRRLSGESPRDTRGAPICTVTRITTPLGPMVAGALEDALCLLEFADRRMLPTQFKALGKRTRCLFVPGTTDILDRIAAQLSEYFGGRRSAFDVPTTTPGTEFQKSVWAELRRIPYGKTASYKEVAHRIGRATAVRAVAKANGDNRITLVIPCHRVVGSDGSLTGYGGGLWRKQSLLDLERC
jgi:AraC family transcriptional regulator, regulatory protein of adaptative response / methylated-DNA-[protein]-cysteine methyltransferase